MNRDPRFRIVLPTDELVQEYAQADNLLGLIQTTVKDVVRYAAEYWISNQQPWDTGCTPIDQLHSFMDVDFLYNYRYTSHDSRDIADIRHVLARIGISVYLNIMPVLDGFKLPDFVTTALQTEGWLGNSLVVSTVNSKHLSRPYGIH